MTEDKKKEILPQIDNVEKELKKNGLGIFLICSKKDKAGEDIKTKKGKNASFYKPYHMGFLRILKNEQGHRLQWYDDDCPEGKCRGTGITEKEYNIFRNSTSSKKRLNIFLKYQTQYVIRKIKQDKRIMIRLSEDDLVFAQEMARKAGISVSDLIRKRLRGTIIHEALSTEEVQTMNVLLQMAAELKQYGTALKNYLKTTGISGVQRLDSLFQSQPGTDYAKAILRAANKINKLIKYSDDN
jgi:predicted DNA binding CopG/RHH family protein